MTRDPAGAETRLCTDAKVGQVVLAWRSLGTKLVSPRRVMLEETSGRILDSGSRRASGNGAGGRLCQGLLSSWCW